MINTNNTVDFLINKFLNKSEVASILLDKINKNTKEITLRDIKQILSESSLFKGRSIDVYDNYKKYINTSNIRIISRTVGKMKEQNIYLQEEELKKYILYLYIQEKFLLLPIEFYRRLKEKIPNYILINSPDSVKKLSSYINKDQPYILPIKFHGSNYFYTEDYINDIYNFIQKVPEEKLKEIFLKRKDTFNSSSIKPILNEINLAEKQNELEKFKKENEIITIEEIKEVHSLTKEKIKEALKFLNIEILNFKYSNNKNYSEEYINKNNYRSFLSFIEDCNTKEEIILKIRKIRYKSKGTSLEEVKLNTKNKKAQAKRIADEKDLKEIEAKYNESFCKIMDPLLLEACNRLNFCTIISTAKALGIETIKGTSRGDSSVFIRETDALKIIRACREKDLYNSSLGETAIKIILEENHIIYNVQHTFNGCKDTNKLPFDFYLPDYNVAIEYQGKQHFNPSKNWNSHYLTEEESIKEFERNQKHDQIKREFCEQSDIILLTPDYRNTYKEIEEMIKETLGIE